MIFASQTRATASARTIYRIVEKNYYLFEISK